MGDHGKTSKRDGDRQGPREGDEAGGHGDFVDQSPPEIKARIHSINRTPVGEGEYDVRERSATLHMPARALLMCRLVVVNRCGPHMHWGDEGAPAAGANADLRNNVLYNCAFEQLFSIAGPATAYNEVLAQAGAWPRDAMNERTVQEVVDGTGALGIVGDALIEDGPAPPADVDRDGMADDSTDDHDDDGWTNIEEYLHVRAMAQLLG